MTRAELELLVLYDKRECIVSWAQASVTASQMFRCVYGAAVLFFALFGSGFQLAYVMVAAAAGVWSIVVFRSVLIVRLERVDRRIAQRETAALEERI